MDRSAAIAALPEVYRVAIELREAGAHVDEIASRLGIEIPAVDPLLAIGERKLLRLIGEPSRPATTAEPV